MVEQLSPPWLATAAEYLGAIQQLLPRGKAWLLQPASRAYLFALGLSREFVRLHEWLVDLGDELDPSTATETLATWEEALGLPEEGEVIAATLAERRIDVVTKLLGRRIRTEADWIAFAEAAGYTGATVVQASETMCTCNSTCNAYVQGPYYDGWVFTLILPGTQNTAFEALAQKIAQAGGRVIFEYV